MSFCGFIPRMIPLAEPKKRAGSATLFSQSHKPTQLFWA
jgi:hypothetical protein